MSTGKTLLLLCDHPAEQKAALEVLRSVNPTGQNFVTDNEEAAFFLFGSEKIDCVFCHSSGGPEMAVNFLSEVWNRAPNVSRFVLAPSIDAETQARCAFGAHHFLSTPLDSKAVRVALEEAELKNVLLPQYRVQVLLSKIRHLPSKPSLYFEVLRQLESPDASVGDISAIIQKDLGIASKLLQVVNSVYYGRAETVHQIEEAVLFLGFELTASIVLSLEALSRFDKGQTVQPLADEVWAHSQTLAELARRIAQGFGQNRAGCDKTYLAGLLHDLGRLVLAQNFREDYQKVTNAVREKKGALTDLESDLLGLTHAEAGAYLLAAWGLPIAVVQAVAFHHSPARTVLQNDLPSTALHIAEHIIESDHLPLEEIIDSYPKELRLFEQADVFSELVPDRPPRTRVPDAEAVPEAE